MWGAGAPARGGVSFHGGLITHDPSDAAIVKAIIGLARELNMELIAEGVETAEQLEQLRAWGCCLVQGYYFARPLPSGEVGSLLADGVIHPVLRETSPRT